MYKQNKRFSSKNIEFDKDNKQNKGLSSKHMKKDKDNKQNQGFIKKAQLLDHFRDKYPQQIRTFLYGNKRIDYVKRIGYLGTHDAGESDHSDPFADLEQQKYLEKKSLIYYVLV